MWRAISIACSAGLILLTGLLLLVRIRAPTDGVTIKLIAANGMVVEPIPGATTDLHDGDIVQAIDGVSVTAALPLPLPGITIPKAAHWQAEASIPYQIMRAGQRMVIPVRLHHYPLQSILASRWPVMLYIAVWLVVSLTLRLAKPNDFAAQLVFWIGLCMGSGVFSYFLGEPLSSLFDGASFWLFQIARYVYFFAFIFAIAATLTIFQMQQIAWLGHLAKRPLGFASIPWLILIAAQLLSIAVMPSAQHWLAVRIVGGGIIEMVDVLILIGMAIGSYLAHLQIFTRHYFRWAAAFAVICGGGIILFLYIPFLTGNQSYINFNALALLELPYPLIFAFVLLRQRIVDVVFVPLLITSCIFLTGVVIDNVLAGYLQVVTAQWPPSVRSTVALLVATAVAPLFWRFWQRNINWLLYGDCDDPSAILSHLGQRLDQIAAPTEIFQELVETIAQLMRVSYVALRIKQGDQFLLIAASGSATADAMTIELRQHSETIGQLVLARARFWRMSQVEQRLVEGLVQQAAHVISLLRLTQDLQHAREHLVTVREEERRRLRHDLHDGLGAALAACRLMAHSIRATMANEPRVAERTLNALDGALKETIESVRQLVYNLRPPKLDDLGLIGALRDQAEQYQQQQPGASLTIRVLAPANLGPLPVAT